jgi:hypothetical protein
LICNCRLTVLGIIIMVNRCITCCGVIAALLSTSICLSFDNYFQFVIL